MLGILFVIPAKAGIQTINFQFKKVIFDWIPASAGMTLRSNLIIY